jgi:hypothetical protein
MVLITISLYAETFEKRGSRFITESLVDRTEVKKLNNLMLATDLGRLL